MADIVEQRITPNTPRVIDNQEVKVYVPVASSSQKGVAVYNSTDFVVDNNGKVRLRYPLSMQRQYADPLHDPNKMSHITEVGHEADNSVSFAKFLDIEFQHVLEGEYGYDPRSVLGVLKLNRKQLSTESFTQPSMVMIDPEDFLQVVTPDGYTKSNIKWPIYPIDNTTEDVVADTIRKLGFTMDHIYFDIDEKKRVKPLLPRASVSTPVRDAEDGFGMVRINTEDQPWLHFVPEGDLEFNEEHLHDYITDKVTRIVPNYPDSSYIKQFVISDPEDPDGMRKLSYQAKYVKKGMTVVSQIDGKEYTNGAQLPYGEPFNEEKMVQRTVLLLTKAGIGLDKIPNTDPKDWDVSNPVRTLLNILQSGEETSNVIPFSKKKDEQAYNEDVGLVYEQSDNPTTVKQRIANIEAKLGDLTNISYGFLGYLTVPEGSEVNTYLNEHYPVDTQGFNDLTHIFVTNTNTLWGWTAEGWVDTKVSATFGDEFKYKLNGVVKTIKITSGETLSGTKDFVTKFDNSIAQLQINVPYVLESKYLHDWSKQLSGGTENFTKGKYKKVWFGTSEEYEAEFPSEPDDSIITFVTDDSYQYEGNLIDEAILEARLDQFTEDLLTGIDTSKTYLIAPKAVGEGEAPLSKGWALKEVDMSGFLTLKIPKENDITNIVGAGDAETGILRYNGMDFALFNTTDAITDSITGVKYKSLRETPNLATPLSLGREGTRAGAYLTIADLQNNFGTPTVNKTLFKHLMDTQYLVTNYPKYEVGKPGNTASSTLQTAIGSLWNAIINIDTTVNTEKNNYSAITNKLNKYPDPDFNWGEGQYLLVISKGSSNQMTMAKFSDLYGSDILSEKTNLPQWIQRSGDKIVQSQPITPRFLATCYEEASRNLFTDARNSVDIQTDLHIWVGTNEKYQNIVAQQAIDTNTLYVCVDGYLYFGARLIGKSGLTLADVAQVVNMMDASQVQTLLNKLNTI